MPLPSTFPELAALDLLRSVVELGSVSRAARAHGITQPSASSRIRTLERQLGVTVLDRSPTGSSPTPDGHLVVAWAADVLRAAESLAAGVASLKAEQHGLLRLAASYTIAEYVLPPALERFLADRPDDSVTLEVTNSQAVIERVERGAVDLGFVESPAIPHQLAHRTIGADQLVPVVASRHPWAEFGTVSLDDFVDTPLVLRERGSGTRESLEVELARLGYPAPRSALDLGSTSAVRIAVINGASPTVISRLAVADDLARGRLVEIEVPGLDIHRTLRAIHPAGAELPRLASALLQSIA